jgi:uncharacterized protein
LPLLDEVGSSPERGGAPLTLTLVAVLALVAGVFIGAIGIGGIILVTGLIYIGGMKPQTAIAACMMGYLLSGVVGTWQYARANSIRWPMAAWLCLGAMPAALAGAMAANNMPAAPLEFGIGLLTAGAGLHALYDGSPDGDDQRALGCLPLLFIGALTGFGSAVTGTGGPLLLVPILLWLQVQPLTAIGLSQAIQIPIAALATAGNLYYGAIDPWLGGVITAALAAGSWIGARIAHQLPRATLRKLVAVVLTLVGCIIVLKIGSQVVGGVP